MPHDLHAGFRRILYDAMTLSVSLRVLQRCSGYPKPSPAELDGDVEAHHIQAFVQMHSLNEFLTSNGGGDDMGIGDFGCPIQEDRLPTQGDDNYRFRHTYAGHKSWQAVAKDASAGAAQMEKPEVVRRGLKLLDGFDEFWRQCGVGTRLQTGTYEEAYCRIYLDTRAELARARVVAS